MAALVGAGLMGLASVAEATAISIYTAPDKTYGNTANSPCIFYGPGLSGCNKDPIFWDRNTEDTNQAFPAIPLTFTYSGQSLAEWVAVVGRNFVLGFDVNDTSSTQFLETMTITTRDAANNILTAYDFSPTTATPSTANGVGYADYILSAGCDGVTTGLGVSQMCGLFPVPNSPQYHSFFLPTAATSLTFTFRLANGNDGSDKIFALGVNPTGTPTQTCTLPGECADTDVVPEPASLMLLGTGLLALTARAKKRRGR
jgi:hypothetical protein